jgi:DNA polymerase III delta subunit
VKGDRRYADFLQDLRREPAPVYVFTGSDEFLKREALRKLTETLVPEEARQFNCQSFLAAEAAWQDVETACLSAPLFATRRVVSLIGVELLGQADASGLAAYTRRPSGSTCLVAMTAGAGDETRRRGAEALGRAMAAAGAAAYVFWPGNVRDCRAWARAWLRDRQRTMAEAVLEELSEARGNSAYEVWNVIEKAAGFAGVRKEITKADVASVGGAASLGSASELRRVVALGDGAAAHTTATRCLDAGDQPTLLLWVLNRAFRHALRGPEGTGVATGERVSGGRRELRWPEKRDVEAIQRRFDREGLCRAIWLLYETERGIKSGVLDPALGLDVLINELTGRRAVRYLGSSVE